MAKNKSIINRTTYLEFIVGLLVKLKGAASKQYILDCIETQFADQWTATDRRIKKVGEHGQQPTWKNEVDWAIVQARRNRRFFLRDGVLILNTKFLRKAVRWAGGERRQKQFIKFCPECGTAATLQEEKCAHCKSLFNPPKKRREAFDVVPALTG